MIDWILYNKSFNLKFLPFLSSKYEIDNYVYVSMKIMYIRIMFLKIKKRGYLFWDIFYLVWSIVIHGILL